MIRSILVASAIALVLPNPANAALYTVGTGPGCQFTTIQAAINAAASNPGEDTVRISNLNTIAITPTTALTIGQQDLTLDGRFVDCTSTIPNGNFLQLVGTSGNPLFQPSVLTITGSGVRRLIGIQVRDNVARLGDNGGAITFSGTGELVLTHVQLTNNVSSSSGGAIRFTGSNARLTLESDVEISLNSATTHGGGVALVGNVALFAVAPNIAIVSNAAGQMGGGIYLEGDAKAYIGSPGLSADNVLRDNIAVDGGAIALNAGFLTNAQPLVNVFTTNVLRSTTLRGNRASSKGGAIYLRPSTGTAVACLEGTYFVGNRAQEGAAIYGDVGDALVYYNRYPTLCNLPPELSRVFCTRNLSGCGLLELNRAENSGGSLTPGAVVLMQDRNTLSMGDFTFGNNTAQHVIRVIENTRLELNQGLAAVNTLSGSAFRFNFRSGDEGAIIRNLTIANNTIGPAPVFQFEDGPETLRFNHNLVWQPGRTLVTIPGSIANSANYNWDFNTGNDVSILPPPWNVSVANPRFVDFNNNNYRLRVGSRAVDLYPNIAPFALAADLDGRQRPSDIPLKLGGTNDFGITDPGAFETQPTDDFILNGRFNSNLSFWLTEAPAGSVSWNPTDSGTAPGTGHAAVNIPMPGIGAPNWTRVNTLKYCFNVPGNGVYTVSARALQGSGLTADTPILRWRVRQNSENCTGPADVEGDAFFTGGAGWRDLAAPLQIPVNLQSTVNATIELRFDVQQSDFALTSGLVGAFDNVIMTGTSINDLFKDGFEQP